MDRNIVERLSIFDARANREIITLLENVFNTQVQIIIKETNNFNLDDVINNIGEKAALIEIEVENYSGAIKYLVNANLVNEILNYVEEEGEEPPESYTLLKDIIGQIIEINTRVIKEKMGTTIEFKAPEIKTWHNEEHLAYDNSYATYYSISIGEVTTFTLLRIVPANIATKYFVENTNAQTQNAQFEDFDQPGQVNSSEPLSIDFIHDLQLLVSVELGRITMSLKDMLNLGEGSIVELNKFAGEPVDVYVNNKKFAEGEVVVIDQNFAVRITSLISKQDRISTVSPT